MKDRLLNLIWVSAFAFGAHASVVTGESDNENEVFWMRYLENDSSLSLPPIPPAPVPPPTLPPVPPETPPPTDEPQVACEIEVDIVCQTVDGAECTEIVPPPLTCSIGETIEFVTFLYKPSTCPGKNFQGDETFCEDMAPLDPQASVEVLCKNNANGDDLVVEPPSVQPGSTFTVSAPTGSMPDKIDCIIQNDAGVKIQQVVIDTSGTVNLQLKDQFGSFTLVSCAPGGEEHSCLETLCYKIQLNNVGTVLMDVTVADFTLNGETESFLDFFPDTSIDVGQSENFEVKEEVDICSGTTFNVEIDVEASPPNGPFCKDTENYEFTPPLPETLAPVPPETPAPVVPETPGPAPTVEPDTPAPVTLPTVPETLAPVTPPTPPPTVPETAAPVTPPVMPPSPEPPVDCLVDVNIDCKTLDGTPCDEIQPPPTTCADGNTFPFLTFTYNGQTCPNSDNNQGNSAVCEDSKPIPAEPVTIQCRSPEGSSLTVEPVNVSPGGTFTVSNSNGNDLPVGIDCGMFDSSGELVQQNFIDTSGNVDLNLGDTFGAMTLESCGSDASCIVTLCYPIEISNVGTVEMDITVVDLIFNGVSGSLLDQVQVNPLQPGQSTSLEPKIDVNICTGEEFSAEINVEANPPNGEMCQDTEQYTFAPPLPPTSPGLPVPVSPPVSPPVPVPVPPPVSPPVPPPVPPPMPPPVSPPVPPPVVPETPPPVSPPVPPPVPPVSPPVPPPVVPETPPPVSPPVPPPVVPETPPPVSPPVPPPVSQPEPECTIALDADCTVTNTASGQSQQCEGAVPNLEPCTSRPTAITMLFNGGDCSQSDNVQPDKFFCTDLGPISTELGTPYYIVVTDAKGKGITYFSDIVNVGDFYKLGDGTERFEADQIIQIYTPDQATMLQDVQYHSSCSQNLELKNRFGASQIVEFLNEEQGLVSCFETFSFSLNIAVPISVSGEAITLSKLTVDTNFAGQLDLTDQVAGVTVEPGGSVVATLEGEVDFSTAQTYTLEFNIEGTNASGDFCVGQEIVSFEAGGVPPRPPSAPTTSSKKGGKDKKRRATAPSPPATSPVY